MGRSALPVSFAATLALSASACTADAPPPPVEIPIAPPATTAAPAEQPPEIAPARWFLRRSRTLWGPTIGGSTLVLLGGRRALVTGDDVRFETAQAPEPLIDLTVVPGAGGARRVVTVGERGAYRLDDPLGPAVPIARGTARVIGVDTYPGLAAVWTDGGGTKAFIDAETGRAVPTPPGLPGAHPLGLVFASEREGVGLFAAVGLAVTGDGGATWRVVHETGAGDAARVSGIRFVDGAVEAKDADGRPAAVDVAGATLGPFHGAPRAKERTPPPPRQGEPPLGYWMRVSEQNPLALAVDTGVTDSGGMARVQDNRVRARVDVRTGRVVDVEGVDPSARALEPDIVRWPEPRYQQTVLSNGKRAWVAGLGGNDPETEPHVEIQAKGQNKKLPPVRFSDPHERLQVMSPIEEDAEHGLHFVLADQHRAFMVIQRPPSEPATAVPIPGASWALVHRAHGFAVGSGHALVTSDGGASWSDIPLPPGLAEVIDARDTEWVPMAVSAFGARIGDFIRVGWGPPEPPPPPGPPADVTPVPPAEPAGSGETALSCTSGSSTKGPPPSSAQARTVLADAVTSVLKRLGGTGYPSFGLGNPGSFQPSAVFAHDERLRVWVTGWIDSRVIGATPHVWTSAPPAWATPNAWLDTLTASEGHAAFSIESGDRTLLVRVEPDGTADTAEVARTSGVLNLQGESGVGAARRGPMAWIDGGKLMLWPWGEPPRAALSIPGAVSLLSTGDPVPGGFPVIAIERGFGAYALLPLPGPGGSFAPPGVDGWTRFDAAATHPERLPACDRKAAGVGVQIGDRPLHARIDGADLRTGAGAHYRVLVTGKDACVAAVWASFGEGSTRSFVRADLQAGKADGGGNDPRWMRCTWH